MHPIVLEQLVAQHVNELHADAAQHRLIRECRRGPTDPSIAGPDRSAIPGILRFLQTVKREVRRCLRVGLADVDPSTGMPAATNILNIANHLPR
jgi:hypothetical protein